MYGRDAGQNRPLLVLIFLLFLNLLMMSTNIVLKNNRSLFQNIIVTVISPVQVGFQAAVDFFSHEIKHHIFIKNMYRRYYELKQQHRLLKLKNYQLRKQLEQHAIEKPPEKPASAFTYARLVSIDFSQPYHNIVINRGTVHGITPDMVVINEDGDLVGRTVHPISPLSSTVRLVTSPVGGLGAVIASNNLEGLISGDNSRLCSFKYILESLSVRPGDRVLTSGSDRIYPSGIPIGEVVEVKKKYLTQDIRVKPFYLSKPLKKLTVIKPVSSTGSGNESQN